MSLLRAQGLGYGVGDRLLCRGLELAIEAGQCWGILGANGSGKTTLLHTLAGLHPASEGEVLLDGTTLAKLSRRHIAQHLGLLLQDSHDSFPATVLEIVLSGRHPHLGRWENETETDLQLAEQALQQMELVDLAQRQVQTLSGGERRRVAMATLLCQNPALMLLDEPLNHLDLRHQKLLLNTVKELCHNGHTVMMVLHDPNQALACCERIILLQGEGKWEQGTAEEMLTAERLSQLYGCEIQKLEQGFRYL